MLEPDSVSIMVFAAGFGTRMGQLTKNTPKPLLALNGQALIDYTLKHCTEFGPKNIVVNAHYLADQIENHIAGKNIRLSLEHREILDTGGGLKAALPLLNAQTVITMNADTLWTGQNPIKLLAQQWNPDTMDALLMCVAQENAIGHSGHGDFSIAESGQITRGGPNTYASVQILKTETLAKVTETVFSLNRIWDILIAKGTAYGMLYPDIWYDIGTQQSFENASKFLETS